MATDTAPPHPADGRDPRRAGASAALFTIEGDVVTATELSRGPWDPRACHGGPVAALLMRSVEQLADAGPGHDTTWQIARSTVELVRPVPVGVPMAISAELERPGRNVSLVASVLRTTEGVEVARARTLRIREAAIPLDPAHIAEPPFGEPGAGRTSGSLFGDDDVVAYHRDGVEMRFLDGMFDERGPARLWCRLLVPVVAGEEPTGAQRAMAAADFGNGVSGELDPTLVTFLNPDLTVHLMRPPIGEWIGLDARSHYGPGGAGLAESAMFDQVGRVGRAVQSLLLAMRS